MSFTNAIIRSIDFILFFWKMFAVTFGSMCLVIYMDSLVGTPSVEFTVMYNFILIGSTLYILRLVISHFKKGKK